MRKTGRPTGEAARGLCPGVLLLENSSLLVQRGPLPRPREDGARLAPWAGKAWCGGSEDPGEDQPSHAAQPQEGALAAAWLVHRVSHYLCKV